MSGNELEKKMEKKDIPSEQEDLSGVKNEVIEFKTNELATKVDETKKENMEADIADKEWTYRLIRGTTMETKLKAIGKTDEEVKEFSEKIDITVRTYLDKELEGFSNKVKNGMCVGIQFAMMDTLKAEIAAGTDVSGFFDTFGSTDVSTAKSTLTGFFDAFSGGLAGIGKVNKFFTLAKRVENFKQFLVLNKTKIIATTHIPELMNPYKLKMLLSDTTRDDANKIYDIDASTKLTLNATTDDGVVLSAIETTALQDIAESAYGNLSDDKAKKLVANIEKSCGTATRFLEIRGTYHDKASDLFTTINEKIAPILHINIPFIGPLGDAIGVEWTADLLGGRKKKGNKVLDFVLNILGFSGGVSGLHKAYVKEEYEGYMTKDTFTKAAYTAYETGKTTDLVVANTDANSTWMKLGLDSDDTILDLSTDQKIAMQAIIPPQYTLLEKSISDNLIDGVQLNPTVVSEMSKLTPTVVPAPALVASADGKTFTVDMSKISDKNAFAEAYIAYMIPKLIKLGDDFVSSDKMKDSDVFALGLMGTLIGGKYFTESLNLGMTTTADFVDKIKTTSDKTTTTEVGTEITTNKEYISYIKSIITTGESAGEYGAVNPYDVTGVSLGLLQWHDTRAKDLLTKMQETYPMEFATIMGDDFTDLETASLRNTRWDEGKQTKFQALMKEDKFQKVMDDFTETDIKKYITNAVDIGITDPAMIVYYCRMQNTGGVWAKSIIEDLKTKDLTSLNEAFQSSTYADTYPTIAKKFQVLYADLSTKDFSHLDQNLA